MCPIGVTSSKRLLVHGGADADDRIGDAGRFLEGHGAVVPRRFRRGRGGALGLIAPLDRYIVAGRQGGRPRAEPGQVRRARRRGHRRVPPAAAMRGSAAGAGAAVHDGRSGMQHLGVIPHAVERPVICSVSSSDGIARLASQRYRECVVSARLACWVGQAAGRGKQAELELS